MYRFKYPSGLNDIRTFYKTIWFPIGHDNVLNIAMFGKFIQKNFLLEATAQTSITYSNILKIELTSQ